MIAYFDCSSGVSGDMITGALLDAGVELGELEGELKKLPLKGYRISSKKVRRQGFVGTKFTVEAERGRKKGLKDILALIEESKLATDIKEKSIKIFQRLGEAEAKIHGKAVKDIHFYEIGDTDSIIDIVASVIALKALGIKTVIGSHIPVGSGWVKTAHGLIPVPSPATLELLRGTPFFQKDVPFEMSTPTGIAIITTLTENFATIPPMKVDAIGYGAGTKSAKTYFGFLRVLLGEPLLCYEQDEVVVIETNIDDLSPQLYEYLMEKFFEEGAIDVFLTPVHMKKGRPGTVLSVLSEKSKVDKLTKIIFTETTSLGVRKYIAQRVKLPRQTEKIKTRYGVIRAKISYYDGIKRVFPEYEDCKKTARQKKIPFLKVYDETIRASIGNW
ncbi:MAG: hypothetical protein DDT33_01322 [Firmicutes bacterium]|nr:hypothetical protein [Bacillota bacterium]